MAYEYGEAERKAREHFTSKVTNQLNKNITDHSLRFIKLIGLIPNWETYLTVKQRESAQKYVKCMNSYDVDYQLKLSPGTTHQRLFGSKTSKGALGRLEEVYKILEKQGYYDQQSKQKENIKDKNVRSKLSNKSIESFKTLIKLIVETPDYEKYLTKSQSEKVYHFLRLRNVSSVAKECKVTSETIKKVLIGDGGVLEKLQDINKDKTINSWDEI